MLSLAAKQTMRQLAMRNLYRLGSVRGHTACKKKGKETFPGLEKMKSLHEKFQEDDGKPVWLKDGVKDQILYRTTCGLSVLGLLYSMFFMCGYIFD